MKWNIKYDLFLKMLLLPMIMISCSETNTKCRSSLISPELQILNCSFTLWSELELPDADDIKETTVLDFSHTQLDALPEGVKPTSFPNMVHLNLSHNTIQDGVLDLKDFRKLKTIDLSFNKLFDMDTIVIPPNALTLSFESNELSVVHLNTGLVKLKELHLQGNHITDIISNTLNALNEEIQFELQLLNMTGNKLKDITRHHLAPFEKLQELYLANNGMTSIDEGSFDSLPFLEKIDLSQNNLKVIPLELFSKNDNLKHLDMSGNQLQTLSSHLSNGLDWLDVSFNKISILKESFSSVLYPVRVFLIGGNPLSCTCEILWLKELYNVRKYLAQYLKISDLPKFTPVCAKPAKLDGKLWSDLEDEVFECVGLAGEDLKLTNEKIASVLNEDDMLKTTSVTADTVGLKLNVISTKKIDFLQLSYYPFGKKKESLKTIKLSSKTTSHSISSLQANTPYVICISVTIDKPITNCIEVVTEKSVVGSIEMIVNILRVLKDRIDIIAATVGLLSLIYILYMLMSPE